MSYISRKLLVEKKEISDIDFFNLNAPLIILGEPGAGKSRLAEKAKEKLNAKRYNAFTIGALQSLEPV